MSHTVSQCDTAKSLQIWLGGLLAAHPTGGLARHQSRINVVAHDLTGDNHLGNIRAAGYVIHDMQQDFFEDGSQATGTGTPQQRLIGNLVKGLGLEFKFDTIEIK